MSGKHRAFVLSASAQSASLVQHGMLLEKHVDKGGVASGLTQALPPSSSSQHEPPGQSLGSSQSGPPVVPLDAEPVWAEPLVPVIALPLPAVPPLVEPLEVVEPLVVEPLDVIEPLVVAPLVSTPSPDDPLASEPAEDSPLEPLAVVDPEEPRSGATDPPHATTTCAVISAHAVPLRRLANLETLIPLASATGMPDANKTAIRLMDRP